ncbi:MAG: NDP-sugar synthase [Nitrospinae bacterium]|nr:NDP-sugar synthase [Nitrospinota bacterium]MBF0633132.1 NDP-sugar synthase [Nitrospinota bacterium]
MNAMILAAGFGTRLLPHTLRLPKPLFPVLGETLLGIAIQSVLKARPGKVVVNTHHLPEKIAQYINSRDFGVEIIVTREDEILGTAGGIKHAEPWLRGDDFIVLNSDIIMEPPWDALISAHKKTGAVATLALRANPDTTRYGTINVNEGGEITRFLDTRAPTHTRNGHVLMFTGASVISPAIFDLIPAGRAVDISGEVYKPLVTKGGRLYGVVTDSPWRDVGTVADYHATVMDALRDLREPVIDAKVPASAFIANPVYIEKGATIGELCHIGPNAAIHGGAVIEKGARLTNCVVLPESVVEGGTLVTECVR